MTTEHGLSPQGLTGNYIHSLASSLPCSHALLTDNHHDVSELPQQERNACFSHTAGQFALGIKITLLELLKQLPQLPPAALTSQYSRMGQSGVMLSFPMAPHICSHHPHTHLLSPMQQVLSGDGACPPSQQTQQDADSSLGPAGILALGLPHILQFSWPADDGDWHKPSYDLIVLPGCSIH